MRFPRRPPNPSTLAMATILALGATALAALAQIPDPAASIHKTAEIVSGHSDRDLLLATLICGIVLESMTIAWILRWVAGVILPLRAAIEQNTTATRDVVSTRQRCFNHRSLLRRLLSEGKISPEEFIDEFGAEGEDVCRNC